MSAIRCYQCKSLTDPNCGKEMIDSSDRIREVDCDHQPKPNRMEDFMPVTKCNVVVTKGKWGMKNAEGRGGLKTRIKFLDKRRIQGVRCGEKRQKEKILDKDNYVKGERRKSVEVRQGGLFLGVAMRAWALTVTVAVAWLEGGGCV